MRARLRNAKQSKAKHKTNYRRKLIGCHHRVLLLSYVYPHSTTLQTREKHQKLVFNCFVFFIGFFFVCVCEVFDFVFNLFSFYRETSYKETIASILCRRCRYHLLYSCRRRYCFIILNNVQRMKMKRNWSLTYRGVRWLWICYLIPSISNSFIFISRF